MKPAQDKLSVFLICVILAAAVLIAYEPLRHNGFVNYDDGIYITENPQVKAGITSQSVIWAFTTGHTGNWHPLTWLSHMLDCELFGLNPLGHHISSLLFHIANTLLLFWVFNKATGTVWPSAFVAAAFALHPVHVESVAWAAERKDVLSGFFWMLTMIAYIRYAERPGIRRYLPVAFALSLGLMAKPMLVTLPFVLLLLDYWPLGRFQWDRWNRSNPLSQSGPAAITAHKSSPAFLIMEKFPLFVLATASSIVTYLVQRSAGSMQAAQHWPLTQRIANALISYVGYIGKMIYPSRLAVLYPHPLDGLPMWQQIACLMLLVAITAGVIYTSRRRRYPAVGWLWYLGTLIPVIGLVQVGVQAMADRYTYLPSIGIFIIIAWGAAELSRKWHHQKITLAIATGLVLVALLFCTRIQLRHWQNSFTLCGHALKVTENNYTMHNNYGNALRNRDRNDESVVHFRKALQINPQYYKAWINLGMVYLQQGKTKQAIDAWNKVLQLKDNCADVINNLAWIKATNKNPDFHNPGQAVRLALRACKLAQYNRPDYLDTLAAAYAAAGRFSQATETAKRALYLAETAGRKVLTNEIKSRLQLYKAGKPYREPNWPIL